MSETRILFLCTGNSCRSQMAQGWAKRLGGTIAEIESAGIEAHGKNPRAISVRKKSWRSSAPPATKCATALPI